MGIVRIVGVILLVAGVASFFTGGFSFTKESTAAKIGGLELTMKEKESVLIPQWLSIAAVVAGVAALALGGRKG